MLTLLFVLFLLVALYLFLIFPKKPRRPLGKLCHWDYAHRGLWNQTMPENSLAAFSHAVENGFGMELDVYLTRDGEMVVFHDDNLEDMTGIDREIEDCTLQELRSMRLKGTRETIPTFDEVLSVVDGKTPMIVELKSGHHILPLCVAVSERMKRYEGPWCMESFDPRAVHWFRKHDPNVLRGQLAEGFKLQGKGPLLGRLALSLMLCNFYSRPDFIAYEAACDKNLSMFLLRWIRPTLVCWTIRSQKEMDRQRSRYDLQIFEGFMPKG